MNNLSDLTVEELLDVKGGSADTPIINCQAENSGYIVVQPEKKD